MAFVDNYQTTSNDCDFRNMLLTFGKKNKVVFFSCHPPHTIFSLINFSKRWYNVYLHHFSDVSLSLLAE